MATQSILTKLAFFDRPFQEPVCQLGATIAYFMVITIGFFDPRHANAFAMTFSDEFNEFARTSQLPCTSNATIVAGGSTYLEACPKVPYLCCGGIYPNAPPSPPQMPRPSPPPRKRSPPPPPPRKVPGRSPPPPIWWQASPPPPPPFVYKRPPPPPVAYKSPPPPPPRYRSPPPPPPNNGPKLNQQRLFSIVAPTDLAGTPITTTLINTLCEHLKEGMRGIFSTYGWDEGIQYVIPEGPCDTRYIQMTQRYQYNITISMTQGAAWPLVSNLNEPVNFNRFVQAADILCGSKVMLVKVATQEVYFTKTPANAPAALDGAVTAFCVRSILAMRKS